MENPDLIVIGGGAAAIAVARTVRRRGASVVMVTDGPPGGDCTFTGCVPSKALLAAGGLPFADAIDRVHQIVAGLAATESAAVLTQEGITVVRGYGVVKDPGTVVVDGAMLRTKRLVLATGSAPVVPALPGLAEVPYLTNETLFELTTLPQHLVVLGGGAIGCEMALAFRQFGARVTLLEGASRLLGKEEPAASRVVHDNFVARGIDVRTATTVTGVAKTRHGVEVETATGPITATHLLVAVGRKPLTGGTEALDLVRSATGAIEVDPQMRTSLKNVYAAGDVTGRLPFTHAAHEMGRIAAGNAFSRIPSSFRENAVPWVTFTAPEVARVGLTEDQAARQLKGARVVELAMADVDRAKTAQRTEGFVKIVVAPKKLLGNTAGGQIVGATIVADRAGEMLAEIVLAMRTKMFAGRLAQTSHAYPTWSMAVQEAMSQLFGYGEQAARPAQTDAGS